MKWGLGFLAPSVGHSDFAIAQNANLNTDTTSYIFPAGFNMGTADANRRGIVAVSGTGADPTAVTINGNSATKLSSSNNGTDYLSIWIATVAAGGTGAVVVTYASASSYCCVNTWKVVMANTTPYDTASNSGLNFGGTLDTTSVDIPAGGFCVAAFAINEAAGTIPAIDTSFIDDGAVASDAGTLGFADREVTTAVSAATVNCSWGSLAGTTDACSLFVSFY